MERRRLIGTRTHPFLDWMTVTQGLNWREKRAMRIQRKKTWTIQSWIFSVRVAVEVGLKPLSGVGVEGEVVSAEKKKTVPRLQKREDFEIGVGERGESGEKDRQERFANFSFVNF